MSIDRRSLLKGAVLSPASASLPVTPDPAKASLSEILLAELAMSGIELDDIDVDGFLDLDK